MTERALDQELGNAALGARHRRIGCIGVGGGGWPIVLMQRRWSSTAASRDHERDGERKNSADHGVGFVGTLIEAMSTASGTSVAGRAGAVAASGMLTCSAGSGDEVL